MSQIRIGIFGLKRGKAYLESALLNNADVVAVCDKDPKRLQLMEERFGDAVARYEDFDEFIEHPMDAVVIANYFHEHTPYAIRALDKGIHVLSECISNATMAEGVALVRAAEKSNAYFMLAENYPFFQFNQEMARICKGGSLGKILYAEGEYNHPGNIYATDSLYSLYDSEKHWRRFIPRTYYVTHSLAPIMHATGALPIRVTAMPIYAPLPEDATNASCVGDQSAVITILNDDHSVFKVTGHSSFGAKSNSYRFCGEKGQVENVRGSDGCIMLRYNGWDKPEGREETEYYKPECYDPDYEKIKKTGHGGGDFYVVREFLNCIKENRKPEFDEYFSTRMASVAILGYRSMMEYGVPYDIPDFRKEEDRKKYENDTLSPFYYSDGRTPTIACCSNVDYAPSEEQVDNFKKRL